MKRRKTYNKYDKSIEEVKSEPKILTEDEKISKEDIRKALEYEKKRKEEIRKLFAEQLSFMSMFEPYDRF